MEQVNCPHCNLPITERTLRLGKQNMRVFFKIYGCDRCEEDFVGNDDLFIHTLRKLSELDDSITKEKSTLGHKES